MALRKRRPVRGNKSSFNASNTKSSHPRTNSGAWNLFKASNSKVKEIEDRLKSLLSQMCELPNNADKHLESVYEELKEIETTLELAQIDQRALFGSSIGRLLFTVKHVTKETYVHELRSLDIDHLLKTLMMRSAQMIGNAVSFILK